MPLRIIRQDITKIECDAIVNPTNTHFLADGGVDSKIHKAAGKALGDALSRIGECAVGEAVMTDGYDLPARYIIHTVGPVWRGGIEGEEALLRSCYQRSMELALRAGCVSIAFPLISSGLFGYPKEGALRLATEVLSGYLDENEIDVYLVVYDKSSYEISRTLADDVQAFIDDNYVSEENPDARSFFSRRNRASGSFGRAKKTKGRSGASNPQGGDCLNERSDRCSRIDAQIAAGGRLDREFSASERCVEGIESESFRDDLEQDAKLDDAFRYPPAAGAVFCLSDMAADEDYDTCFDDDEAADNADIDSANCLSEREVAEGSKVDAQESKAFDTCPGDLEAAKGLKSHAEESKGFDGCLGDREARAKPQVSATDRPVHRDSSAIRMGSRMAEFSGSTHGRDAAMSLCGNDELAEILRKMDMGFADTLFYYIDKKGITDVECYKRSNVDKKTFSKLKCNRDYRPSKITAVSFAVGLHLSLDETAHLLSTAGMCLSHSSKFDLIIEYFLTTGRYKTIFDVNEVLYQFDQSTLGV